MFKLTKEPINNIILYKYFISNKLDDYMIILILSYLGVWCNIDKNIFFYEDILYIKYLLLTKNHKELLYEIYNTIRYDDILRRYEKPPVAIYHIYINLKKNKDGIYIQMNYEANGAIISILEKNMKIDEQIIRFMTVKNSIKEKVEIPN